MHIRANSLTVYKDRRPRKKQRSIQSALWWLAAVQVLLGTSLTDRNQTIYLENLFVLMRKRTVWISDTSCGSSHLGCWGSSGCQAWQWSILCRLPGHYWDSSFYSTPNKSILGVFESFINESDKCVTVLVPGMRPQIRVSLTLLNSGSSRSRLERPLTPVTWTFLQV